MIKISFLKEKWNCKSLIFIYKVTLGESFSFVVFLEKVVQFRWLDTPTKSLSFLLIELDMNYMTDHDSSQMKMMSNSFCASKIVLVSNFSFQTFCEKILISFIIILVYHSQLSESIVFCCHKTLDTFLSAILCGINASRIDRG